MPNFVGIDLGTTNSVAAYFEGDSLKLFRIPQLNAHGVVEPLTTLPSFYYLAEPEELPGSGYAVGEWAREQGAKVPTRLIHSAKSWLSNSAANRKERILPFESAEESRRLTPIEVSAAFLRHIREAWNSRFKDFPLEDQEVVLTVPASFDEAARTLTVEAARLAGIQHLTLLEEPQAAFYNWLREQQGKLETLKEGETILVCDVGGGTTDFSLIQVVRSPKGIGFQRMAVGRHLLLGGDNMDAALCHYVETRIDESLDTTQWLTLRHQARAAKEMLLSGQKRFSFWIPGKGSQVVGGGKSAEITEEEVAALLLDGFFGLYSFDAARVLVQGSGIRNMGLPYERDPSITKHLAVFLNHQQKPNYILFNGGVMKTPLFRQRVIDSIDKWFPGFPPLQALNTSSLDYAVGKGAAYYGKVRQGEGIRIGGGIPRTFYLKIEGEKVVTLVPRGTEEGTELISEHLFSLLPNTPVSFELYHSHTRIADQAGDVIPFENEEMTPLPSIETSLRFGANQENRIPVKLCIKLTEIGTLELWLFSTQTEHRWKLEFQLNRFSKEKRREDETYDQSFLETAKKTLMEGFAVGGSQKLKVLMPSLENVIQRPRSEWPLGILRGLFEPLLNQAEKRSLSPTYAVRFWNLAGFLLRPGRGYPLDDFRVSKLWKLILADSKTSAPEDVHVQKCICFRRISAGLLKGQQMQIFNELFPLVYDKKKKCLLVRRRGGSAYTEQIRTLASLELVETNLKVKLGSALVQRIIASQGEPCDFWALGRLGARELMHGTAANICPKAICEEWIAQLVKLSDPQLVFPLALMGRKSDCRELNLSPPSLEKIAEYLETHAGTSELALFKSDRELSFEEKEKYFGDSLPHGLSLTSS